MGLGMGQVNNAKPLDCQFSEETLTSEWRARNTGVGSGRHAVVMVTVHPWSGDRGGVKRGSAGLIIVLL